MPADAPGSEERQEEADSVKSNHHHSSHYPHLGPHHQWHYENYHRHQGKTKKSAQIHLQCDPALAKPPSEGQKHKGKNISKGAPWKDFPDQSAVLTVSSLFVKQLY